MTLFAKQKIIDAHKFKVVRKLYISLDHQCLKNDEGMHSDIKISNFKPFYLRIILTSTLSILVKKSFDRWSG